MSILDDNPLLSLDVQAALKASEPQIEAVMKQFGPNGQRVWDAMQQGATPAVALGLEKHHLEALYTQGYDLLRNGDIERSRAIFLTLMQLDPNEERNIYCLAATYQLAGDLKAAARLYVLYCAMDATNPDGYLRVGECLMAAGEYEDAYDVFENAALESERGNGTPEAGVYARQMMARVKAAA